MSVSWKTLRVFISSTFRDMQAERDHLVRFVFPRLREELLKHRLHLIDVDLRWGVTSDQNAVSICREVIDECHPRFMGMLGGRYGWIPEGHEQSITADEIRYGVLERDAELWGNALFYFRDEAATTCMVEDAPGDFREPEGSENARKLAELKQSIVNAGLPAFTYGARWDAIQERLTELEAFGDHVFSYLQQNIQNDPELADRFTSSISVPVDEFAEEREAMETFIEDRTERYVVGSRQALLDKMTAFAAASGEQNILVIEGEPGSGKSSLLGKFCQLLATQRSSLVITHFVGASVGSTNLRRTLRRLCHEFAAAAGNNDPLPEDIRELIDRFSKLLGEAAARQRVVLVIDAINQFDATDGAHYMNWLPLILPPKVRVICSSLEHPALAALRRRGEPVRIEKLELLSGADASEIIDAFLQRYSKRLSPEQIAALMAKPESRLPLYVLTALQELRTLGTYEEITARIRELPGDAKALFGWILKERLSNDPGFRDATDQPCGMRLVSKFASYLGVSRHGLSQEELIGLIDPGDPMGNVAALLRLMRPYFMHRGELLDFFHGQLREATEETYLGSVAQRVETHRQLAIYFHAAADPDADGKFNGNSPHALSELAYHKTSAEMWPEVVSTLENIFFLEAKVIAGMAFDLISDFSAAVARHPVNQPHHRMLTLLEEGLRRDIHFIARHAQDYPQGLFQCLWNSCWWYDCPNASKHYQVSDGHWNHPGAKLHVLLEKWRQEREAFHFDFPWLRYLRPPSLHLGTAQKLVMRGHESTVNNVCFSPDGQRIISGSSDRTVRIWDVASGAELAVLRGHETNVDRVSFSPDGQRIASGSQDRTLRIWDVASGAELAVLRGHESYLLSVCFSPDGQRIASGSNDGTIRIWDATSGAELAVLRGYETRVYSVCFSPDGQRIVSGSCDKKIRIWDVARGVKLAVLRGHESSVFSVCFSPDGQRIASGSSDDTIRIWDAASGAELAVLRGHEDFVNSICFSPDGQRIVSGSCDKTIRIWDAVSGAEADPLRGHEGRGGGVSFSPDGQRIASGSNDGTIRIWDATSGVELAVLCRRNGVVMGVSFSPDGRRIASNSGNRTVCIWDAANGTELAVLRGDEIPALGVCFSPDGQRMAKLSEDYTISIRDAASGAELAVLRGHESHLLSVCYSPDGQRIVSGSSDRTVRIWDVATGAELAVLRGHNFSVDSVCISPDGRRIASGSGDKTIRIWDAASGAELAVLRGHESYLLSVRFSPDGRQIASGSDDKTIRIWDAASGAELAVLRGHESHMLSVHFSPDGRRIASGSEDKTIRVWDATSGAELAVLRGHEKRVNSVCFSPDGQRIVSASDDRTIRTWDAATYECTEKMTNPSQSTDGSHALEDPKAFPYFLSEQTLEVCVQVVATDRIICWESSARMTSYGLGDESTLAIQPHPSGRRWAGISTNYLTLLELEGATRLDHWHAGLLRQPHLGPQKLLVQ
jgi:WD40 repeat protein